MSSAVLLLRFRHGCPVLPFAYDNNAVCLLVALLASGRQITDYPSMPVALLREIYASALSKEWS